MKYGNTERMEPLYNIDHQFIFGDSYQVGQHFVFKYENKIDGEIACVWTNKPNDKIYVKGIEIWHDFQATSGTLRLLRTEQLTEEIDKDMMQIVTMVGDSEPVKDIRCKSFCLSFQLLEISDTDGHTAHMRFTTKFSSLTSMIPTKSSDSNLNKVSSSYLTSRLCGSTMAEDQRALLSNADHE